MRPFAISLLATPLVSLTPPTARPQAKPLPGPVVKFIIGATVWRPRGVSSKTVKAAIDISHDRRPDVIIAEICRKDSTAPEGCDYTCGKTFLKSQGGWKLVDESAPC